MAQEKSEETQVHQIKKGTSILREALGGIPSIIQRAISEYYLVYDVYIADWVGISKTALMFLHL